MSYIKYILAGVLIVLASSLYAEQSPMDKGPALVWKVNANIYEVIDSLKMSIEDTGMVVTYTSYASEMLNRTGKLLDNFNPVYEEARILFFCKVGESHNLVASNPHNIVLCPFSIAVYNLIEKPDTVYLSIRKPYEKEHLTQPILKLQTDIILNTISDYE